MDMVERVARAIYDEIKNNGTSPMGGPGTIYVGTNMAGEVVVDGNLVMAALARAAIAAMREPTEGMVRAGLTSLAVTAVGMPEFEPKDEAELCFMAMIDAALTSSEPQAPSSE